MRAHTTKTDRRILADVVHPKDPRRKEIKDEHLMDEISDHQDLAEESGNDPDHCPCLDGLDESEASTDAARHRLRKSNEATREARRPKLKPFVSEDDLV
jgi:hypothetical protein